MKDPLYWSSDDASNAAGFSGRPGGRRDDAGAFWEQNEKGFWWCIDGDTVDTSTLGARKLLQGSDSLYRFDANKGWGMNIRCREDTEITTGAAHSCGAANVHNPNLTYGSMTDQEGNTYKTIVIGTQEWMAENLNTSIYRNGDAIPTGLSNTEWENTINTQQGGWAYYNNDSSYACPYGKLYNWYACVDARALCPTGWHVPSDGEWNILVKNLDPNADTTCVNCGQSTLAGALMKSFGTIEGGSGYWVYFDLSVEGNNNSGFAGLPGGYRSINGDYYYMGYYGFWWSSTQYDSDFAWDRNLYYNNATVNRSNYDTQNGWGVRCLRD
jgi:uncharacterized protein (TIGR02145 family)